jgi:hypothetical protein
MAGYSRVCVAHQKFADRWGYTKQVEIVGMTAQLVVPAQD